MRIAVLIGDREHAARVAEIVRGAGHETVEARPDLVIVDDVRAVEKLRARNPALPILALTKDDDVLARVAALRAGADDSMSSVTGRNFNQSQMVARVDALGRRAALTTRAHEVVEIDGCSFDFDALSASRGDDVVELLPREAALLRFLHANRARPVSRAELLRAVWGHSPEMETRTVDMTVARLRKKIERDPASPKIVTTAAGTGYRFGG